MEQVNSENAEITRFNNILIKVSIENPGPILDQITKLGNATVLVAEQNIGTLVTATNNTQQYVAKVSKEKFPSYRKVLISKKP